MLPKLTTPGVMAAELGIPLHRVLHILNSRRHIQPSARAGTLRLYSKDAIVMVRHELSAQDARKCRQEVRHG